MAQGLVSATLADGTVVDDVGTIDEVEVWGLGVVQEIDAAAMSVWIKYRHLSADTTALVADRRHHASRTSTTSASAVSSTTDPCRSPIWSKAAPKGRPSSLRTQMGAGAGVPAAETYAIRRARCLTPLA